MTNRPALRSIASWAAVAVLSPAAGKAPYGADEAAATDAAKLGNDLNADLVARYPDKFKALVTLPLPHIDASLKELSRAMDSLQMIGVNIRTNFF